MLDPCHTKVDKSQPWPSGSSEPCRGEGPGDPPGPASTVVGKNGSRFCRARWGQHGGYCWHSREMPVAWIDRDTFRVKTSAKPCSQQVGRCLGTRRSQNGCREHRLAACGDDRKGILEVDSRKKWGSRELFWGGFLGKRKEELWGEASLKTEHGN